MPIRWRSQKEIPTGMRSQDTPPPDCLAAANSLCTSQKPLDDKSFCIRMCLGSPKISLGGGNELGIKS